MFGINQLQEKNESFTVLGGDAAAVETEHERKKAFWKGFVTGGAVAAGAVLIWKGR